MKYRILASGSKGNSTYVESGATRLLIDAGLNCKQLLDRMQSVEIDASTIQGILLTHEHSDHISAISVLSKKLNLPVYTNEGTAASTEYILNKSNSYVPEFEILPENMPCQIGDITVRAIPVKHDTSNPMGFILSDDVSKLGYFTDLGIATKTVLDSFNECTGLVLESNHDVDMLRTSDRTFALIQRILGPSGHLSNEAACMAIAEACPPSLHYLTLAHISLDCNEPALARRLMEATLKQIERQDIHLSVVEQGKIGELIDLADA